MIGELCIQDQQWFGSIGRLLKKRLTDMVDIFEQECFKNILRYLSKLNFLFPETDLGSFSKVFARYAWFQMMKKLGNKINISTFLFTHQRRLFFTISYYYTR